MNHYYWGLGAYLLPGIIELVISFELQSYVLNCTESFNLIDKLIRLQNFEKVPVGKCYARNV